MVYFSIDLLIYSSFGLHQTRGEPRRVPTCPAPTAALPPFVTGTLGLAQAPCPRVRGPQRGPTRLCALWLGQNANDASSPRWSHGVVSPPPGPRCSARPWNCELPGVTAGADGNNFCPLPESACGAGSGRARMGAWRGRLLKSPSSVPPWVPWRRGARAWPCAASRCSARWAWASAPPGV